MRGSRSTLRCDTRGANLVEYIFVVGLVAIAALVGVRRLGLSVDSKARRQAACVDSLSCPEGTVGTSSGRPAPAPKPLLETVVTGDKAHVAVDAPKGLTRASVEVVIDKTAGKGLNFFALQVNFDNGTWAHGGLQDLDGKGDDRHLAINWGGLVDRGGGTADYDGIGDATEQAKSLDRIQNPGDGKQLEDVKWSRGTKYVLSIERGALHHFEPGDYVLTHGQPATHVDHPRDLYEWTFTVRPAGGGEPIYQGVLYDSASTLDSFTYWNESGYGSTGDQQQATWSNPSYRTATAPTRDQHPTTATRY